MHARQTRWITNGLLAAIVALGGYACDDGGSAGGFGVALRAERVTLASADDTAQVCVSLDSGGDPVAGTQNDLVWHGECLTLFPGCAVNPATNKRLSTAIRSNSVRALLLSLTDVNPIPDGVLYCCNFRPERLAPGECCPVRVSGAASSDPFGNALTTAEFDGAVCLE
jgi:hypothetical protein